MRSPLRDFGGPSKAGYRQQLGLALKSYLKPLEHALRSYPHQHPLHVQLQVHELPFCAIIRSLETLLLSGGDRTAKEGKASLAAVYPSSSYSHIGCFPGPLHPRLSACLEIHTSSSQCKSLSQARPPPLALPQDKSARRKDRQPSPPPSLSPQQDSKRHNLLPASQAPGPLCHFSSQQRITSHRNTPRQNNFSDLTAAVKEDKLTQSQSHSLVEHSQSEPQGHPRIERKIQQQVTTKLTAGKELAPVDRNVDKELTPADRDAENELAATDRGAENELTAADRDADRRKVHKGGMVERGGAEKKRGVESESLVDGGGELGRAGNLIIMANEMRCVYGTLVRADVGKRQLLWIEPFNIDDIIFIAMKQFVLYEVPVPVDSIAAYLYFSQLHNGGQHLHTGGQHLHNGCPLQLHNGSPLRNGSRPQSAAAAVSQMRPSQRASSEDWQWDVLEDNCSESMSDFLDKVGKEDLGKRVLMIVESVSIASECAACDVESADVLPSSTDLSYHNPHLLAPSEEMFQVAKEENDFRKFLHFKDLMDDQLLQKILKPKQWRSLCGQAAETLSDDDAASSSAPLAVRPLQMYRPHFTWFETSIELWLNTTRQNIPMYWRKRENVAQWSGEQADHVSDMWGLKLDARWGLYHCWLRKAHQELLRRNRCVWRKAIAGQTTNGEAECHRNLILGAEDICFWIPRIRQTHWHAALLINPGLWHPWQLQALDYLQSSNKEQIKTVPVLWPPTIPFQPSSPKWSNTSFFVWGTPPHRRSATDYSPLNSDAATQTTLAASRTVGASSLSTSLHAFFQSGFAQGAALTEVSCCPLGYKENSALENFALAKSPLEKQEQSPLENQEKSGAGKCKRDCKSALETENLVIISKNEEVVLRRNGFPWRRSAKVRSYEGIQRSAARSQEGWMVFDLARDRMDECLEVAAICQRIRHRLARKTVILPEASLTAPRQLGKRLEDFIGTKHLHYEGLCDWSSSESVGQKAARRCALAVLACGHRCVLVGEHSGCCICSLKSICPYCKERTGEVCRNEETSYERESWQCRTPCSAILACGHPCEGTCGECFGGRFHMRCRQECGKPLPYCGHNCHGLCGSPCPPCSELCQRRCKHRKVCRRACGEPCRRCGEPCERQCDHSQCTGSCGERCNVLACPLPCRKTLLKCGHKCVGICGEACSERLCLQCYPVEFPIFPEDETDIRHDCYLLLECGHVLSADGMLKWLRFKMENDTSRHLPRCPICRRVITTAGSHTLRPIVNEYWASFEEYKRLQERWDSAFSYYGTPEAGHLVMRGQSGGHKRMRELVEELNIVPRKMATYWHEWLGRLRHEADRWAVEEEKKFRSRRKLAKLRLMEARFYILVNKTKKLAHLILAMNDEPPASLQEKSISQSFILWLCRHPDGPLTHQQIKDLDAQLAQLKLLRKEQKLLDKSTHQQPISFDGITRSFL